MSAGRSAIRNGGAVSCPNGCGRLMVRHARECRECANARRRRQGGTVRQREAATMREAGATYQRIADELDISPARAHQLVRRAFLAEWAKQEEEKPS